ncbi:branched chain amino acid aminotransferase [Bacillus massiliigorillae]|uniref:branched chain amino acid aminotransferase n=1 Tax=Bacillus massiliigorillae TaxID=1243664 RepID=UPI0003A7508C|nr:branched chain amino acid aminotransferase [Bacillus massiliigorillae]
MLKKQMEQYIEGLLKEDSNSQQIELYKEEKAYVEKHHLLPNQNITITEKDDSSRFLDVYIERCNKETEELIAEEGSQFLNEPLSYLVKHKNEFIYLESDYFNIIGVDAISLEVDDVFGTYNVMLGLKLQKKYESAIKSYLSNALSGDSVKSGIIFSQGDGLWDLNFMLNFVNGYKEDMTLREAYQLIYSFIFELGEVIEEA